MFVPEPHIIKEEEDLVTLLEALMERREVKPTKLALDAGLSRAMVGKMIKNRSAGNFLSVLKLMESLDYQVIVCRNRENDDMETRNVF